VLKIELFFFFLLLLGGFGLFFGLLFPVLVQKPLEALLNTFTRRSTASKDSPTPASAEHALESHFASDLIRRKGALERGIKL